MRAQARLTRRLVVVNLDEDEPTVIAPYRARSVIKALWPRLRRWDAERGCWVVGRGGISVLTDDLRAAGFEVDVWEAGQMRILPPTGERP